jgi:type I restriction enzyme, S subunit
MIKQQTNYKQTEIGKIPQSWNLSKLSDFVNINPTRKLSKGRRAIYVGMADIQPYKRKISNFITKQYKGGAKFINGDTLLARITPCLENGKTVYVDILKDNEVGFGSTEFIVLATKQNKTVSEYIYYLACSPRLRHIAIKSMVGSSGRQRVQTDKLQDTLFTFPLLDEQKQIASILSSLDDKIELNHKMNQTLEETGKTLFKHWFVDLEFPDKDGKPYKSSGGEMVDSELGEMPKGWKVKSLDEIADYLNGLACQKYPPEDEKDALPVIKIAELRKGFTESSDSASRKVDDKYHIKNGDVLFSWSGSLEVCLWPYGEGILNQHLFKVTSEKHPKWFYYFWTLHHLDEFRIIASGKATTMGHIQRKHLTNAKVLVPCGGTLSTMSSTMTPVVSKLVENNYKMSTLQCLRNSLLPRLMSGRIRIN